MLAYFSVRFVIAVFGGALVGLVVGVVGRSVFGADWNVFAVMSWGIMVGSLGLAFAYTRRAERPDQ
jgi:hypothetical protein